MSHSPVEQHFWPTVNFRLAVTYLQFAIQHCFSAIPGFAMGSCFSSVTLIYDLTFKVDLLDIVKVNHHTNCLDQSYLSYTKVIVWAHTDTHTGPTALPGPLFVLIYHCRSSEASRHLGCVLHEIYEYI